MKNTILFRTVLLCGLAAGFTGQAITPADLQQRIAAGEKLTLIDVRPTAYFQKSHIPGAINVPASIVSQKLLPKLGEVVVYDGGLGENLAGPAAEALAGKPGITAVVLDGGLASWEMAKGQTTADPGISAGDMPQITYDKLKAMSGDQLVIVDLRKPASSVSKSAVAPSQPAAPVTDLAAEFPNAKVTKSPFAAGGTPQKSALAGTATPPLLVLIDSGDGSAQAMGRALKANGNSRFVILAGGEEMIARKGKSGLQRAGSTMVIQGADLPLIINTNR